MNLMQIDFVVEDPTLKTVEAKPMGKFDAEITEKATDNLMAK